MLEKSLSSDDELERMSDDEKVPISKVNFFPKWKHSHNNISFLSLSMIVDAISDVEAVSFLSLPALPLPASASTSLGAIEDYYHECAQEQWNIFIGEISNICGSQSRVSADCRASATEPPKTLNRRVHKATLWMSVHTHKSARKAMPMDERIYAQRYTQIHTMDEYKYAHKCMQSHAYGSVCMHCI